MKKLIHIITFAVLFLGINSYAQKNKSIDLNWQSDFDKAKELAVSQEKYLLLYFTGSDWSKASQTLNKEFFYTEKFQKIAKEYLILVRINMPRRENMISEERVSTNKELSEKYQQKVIPTVILTDTTGKELGRVERYNYLKDTSSHYELLKLAVKLNKDNKAD